MDSTSIYYTKSHISFHEISQDVLVMTDSVNGDVYEVNETTRLIWEKLEAGKTPNEILIFIKDIALNAEEIQIEDIMEIIEFLYANGLIHD